jgi:ubiquinone/menaquinone biosynthesis C-methylase UbiE
LNIFKLFYGVVVGLLSRVHAYEERTGKYLSHFKHYVDDAEVIVDVGCGSGAFSKALARQNRLVIALDIEGGLLREIEDSYIEKVCADAHHLPFRDGSVDCAISLTS